MSTAQMVGAGRLPLTRRLASVGWLSVVALIFLTGLVVLAAVGPLIAPYDPDAVDVTNVFAGPSALHWFGTDSSGRDIFSRVIVGTRVTLLGPACVVLVSSVVGTALAVIAAWFGGWWDTVVSRAMDIVFAFPGIVVAIVAVTMFGPGIVAPVIALSVTFVPMIARILRTAALRERNLPYVQALQVQGAPALSIVIRHIVPNLLPFLFVQATVGFGYALLDLSAISYLGLGLQPPAADWGLLISQGQSAIVQGYPQQALFASTLVVLTVIAVNLVGDRLAQRYEIGER
ncbi:ABC transporter permease [Branchiibius cervicis]|uniref:Glutathione transport system permease protein GsiD n=1 Tax=Branchiibius cervicis TaxID=908252 RepID=A0ABW2AT27_9MICO